MNGFNDNCGCLWIILLMLCCGSNCGGFGGNNNCGCILPILALCCCCNQNNGYGNCPCSCK